MMNEKSYFNKSGKVLNIQSFSVHRQSFLQLLKLRKKSKKALNRYSLAIRREISTVLCVSLGHFHLMNALRIAALLLSQSKFCTMLVSYVCPADREQKC